MNAGVPAALAVVVAGMALRPRTARCVSAPAAAARQPPSNRQRWRASLRPNGRRARRPEAATETARWCTDLSRAARSGSTLGAALREVAPPAHAADTVTGITLMLDRGLSLTRALDGVAGVDAELDLAVTVLRACAAHGGSPAEPLDRAAATLRARAADRADRRTHSAQARLSAIVMTWLPLVMLAVLLATSAPVRAAALQPAGLATVGLGGMLNLAGWRWMRRIVEDQR